MVDAYTEESAVLKDKFHAEARAMLRRVKRETDKHGWQSHIHINRAGVAVSGEVTMKIRRSDKAEYLFISVECSALRFDSSVRETDGLLILVQQRTNNDRDADMHPNRYISPSLNSEELTMAIWNMLKNLPEMA